MTVVTRTAFGDVVELTQTCDDFSYLDQSWIPTPATWDLLRSMVR